MSATIRTYSKSCKHNLHYSKYGNQQRFFKIASGSTHFHKTTLCTYICSIIKIQSISLQKIINNSTDTKVRRILICSSVRSACTWKIVLKHENNELNELSECMLDKMFCFFRKTSQNCKTLFYKIFSRSLACLLCFALLYNFLKLFITSCLL